MQQTVKERLIEFLRELKISKSAFSRSIGVSETYIGSMRESIQPDKLKSIALNYPMLDIGWLMTGDGRMIKSSSNQSSQSIVGDYNQQAGDSIIGERTLNKGLVHSEKLKGFIPYYADIPISAGSLDLNLISGNENPTGYMSIPNISAKWLFPVIGCSMLPLIKAGDIIGVIDVNNWDRLDPDKIYMIITKDDRMIKRLRMDNEDDSVIWCISDNKEYKDFKIDKNEVVKILHVVFHGEII